MSVSTPNFDLTQLKLQAKELRDAHRVDASAHARLRQYLARLTLSTDAEIRAYDLGLREAQFVVARENGFASWAALKLHAETATPESVPLDLAAVALMDEKADQGVLE